MPYINCSCADLNLQHWLFLGLSVKSFNGGVNSLADGPSLSVELVYDPYDACPDHPKKKLDNNLEVQNHTGPDPGWLGDSINLIGRPVLFKHGDFEFAGTISRYQKTSDKSGVSYSVELVTPSFILDNTSVILGEYTGAVAVVPNLLNIYGLYENDDCNTYGDSLNYGAGMPWAMIREAIRVLTASIINTSGIVITNYLQSGRLKFIPGTNDGYGIIPEDDTGYILDISEVPTVDDYYKVDGNIATLSEIIDKVLGDAGFEYYIELYPARYNGNIFKVLKIRVIDRTGPIAANSLETFIENYEGDCGTTSKVIGEEVRAETLHNFVIGPPKRQMYWVEWDKGSNGSYKVNHRYWDMVVDMTTTTSTPTTAPPRKTTTTCNPCNFANAPDYCTSTTTTTTSTTTTTPSPGQWSSDSGVGEFMLEIDRYLLDEDLIAPYWGLDVYGNTIFSYMDDWKSYAVGDTTTTAPPCTFPIPNGPITFFNANTSDILKNSHLMLPEQSILISDLELVAALQGEDEWESYIESANTETNRLKRSISDFESRNRGIHTISHVIDKINSTYGPILKPHHYLNIKKIGEAEDIYDIIDEDYALLYNFVRNLAENYYGKKFMVRLPWLCVKRDPDTKEFSFSREIVDGGWNEEDGVEFDPLIGMSTTGLPIDFFRNSDGSIGAFVRFDNANSLNMSELSEDDYGYTNFQDGKVWVKCQVDKEFVFGDLANLSDPRVVITLPGRLFYKLQNYRMDEKGYILNYFNPAYAQYWSSYEKTSNNSTGKITQLSEGELKFAAQPNAITFALQNNQEVYGPWYSASLTAGGKTNMVSDSSLVPWNFGSLAALNTTANAIASFGVSTMYKNETGSITVPGIPLGRLGEEVLAYDNTGYVAGQRYVETRAATVNSSSMTNISYLDTQIVSVIWSGALGPIITGISIAISASGAFTTYNFALYTKGYRRFARAKIDRMKEIGKLRQEMLNRTNRVLYGQG